MLNPVMSIRSSFLLNLSSLFQEYPLFPHMQFFFPILYSSNFSIFQQLRIIFWSNLGHPLCILNIPHLIGRQILLLPKFFSHLYFLSFLLCSLCLATSHSLKCSVYGLLLDPSTFASLPSLLLTKQWLLIGY